MCGCETWSLTLREECSLRVLENKSLRKVFCPKRVEVTGEWRRLHNEEYYSLYSPNIFRVIKSRKMRGRGVWHYWERRSLYGVLVGRPQGKRQLGRSRHRWKGNIKMELQEVRWGGMDWTDLV